MRKKVKILQVDDESDVLDILSIFLGRAGYETCEALGGEEAIAKAKAERPDMIILDILMPEMDGFEVMRELKKDEATARIPIMVLTAKTGEEDRRKGRELGATRYVSKPFTEESLLSEVKRTLGEQRYADNGGG